jgi:hypothetical protein
MAKTIKVYTDEGIDNAIIKGLRHHGLDVLSTEVDWRLRSRHRELVE